MPIDFTGLVAHVNPSEAYAQTPGAFDRGYLRDLALAHERGGFDRVRIGYGSVYPDGLHLGTYVMAITEKLGVMLAHRPGFVAPMLAARTFATIDQLSCGRASIHIISRTSDQEQQRDGDYLTKEARYPRSNEYVVLLRRLWTSDTPFDHEGKYYGFNGRFTSVKPLQRPYIPINFGGSSEPAIEAAGQHADVYALFGDTLAQVREQVAKVRAAARHGREIRFSLSLRPILAETEDAAWARADDILARVRAVRAQGTGRAARGRDPSVGSQGLLEAASAGDRHDKRLWTAVAREMGAAGYSTALVGTPDQVADALLDYHDLGITSFLMRGFDPLEDAVGYGELITRTKRLVAQRTRQAHAAEYQLRDDQCGPTTVIGILKPDLEGRYL